MSFRSRVIAVPLASAFRIFSESTTTWKYENLDAPELEGLLPHAESMVLAVLLDKVATNEIDWNIEAYAGWDRDHEQAATTLLATDAATAGNVLYTITNFGTTLYMPHVRLTLRWRLRAGITVPKEAFYSAILYVTTKGQ